MKAVKYSCTHCGRHFEAEEDKEILECPGCFWSTSVKREEADGFPPPSSLADAGPASPFPEDNRRVSPFFFKRWPLFLGIPLGALALALAAFGIFRADKTPSSGLTIKSPEDSRPTLDIQTLNPADQAVLAQRAAFSADRPLSPEEKKIIENRVSLKTGIVEKLPSQSISLERFKKIVEEQEGVYKVSLPKSYKKKLEKIFEEKYEPAARDFEQGDLLKARDLWVESLNFPIYRDDVQRHRAVALTLLKPFISDTLSKIGSANSMIAERSIRELEKKLSEQYAALSDALNRQDWKAAERLLEETGSQIALLEQSAAVDLRAPPYSQSMALDQGISATLMELITLPAPAIMDLGPLKQDLDAKKSVLESFHPEFLETQRKIYEAALTAIGEKRWEEAVNELKKIQYPPALVGDARRKIEILEKLRQPNA